MINLSTDKEYELQCNAYLSVIVDLANRLKVCREVGLYSPCRHTEAITIGKHPEATSSVDWCEACGAHRDNLEDAEWTLPKRMEQLQNIEVRL